MGDSATKEDKVLVACRDRVSVSIVLYPVDGWWIAQGVQFDITARGRTPIDASERFNQRFSAELLMSIELGDELLLAGVGAAPQEFWELYENAKMHAVVDDASIRLVDGVATTLQVHQELRISEGRLVA
jgi:hypothetical protein